LARIDIPVHTVLAGTIQQHVSRLIYKGTQLHFGTEKQSRYDDPKQVYGVLYLGFDLDTALMESVFHKHNWSRGRRTISSLEVAGRIVRIVGVKQDLRLANITADGVMASVLGLNLAQLSSRQYGHTRRLSAWIHDNLDVSGQEYDGILYPSRNNFPANCVALFSRASHKIVLSRDIELVRHADWAGFIKQHKVGIV
jgi:hypothetical protein